MKPLDNFFQLMRFRKASHFIPEKANILDIGSSDGKLFLFLGDRLDTGVGIDPDLPKNEYRKKYTLIKGLFPKDLPKPEKQFDVVTMLAVVEHIPEIQLRELANNVHDYLVLGGRVIITVPSPKIDFIIAAMQKLKLLDAETLFQHHGFDPNTIPAIFSSQKYSLFVHKTFEFGLNNLFVFEKH